MPVLRIKQNGVWEEISGFSDHTHSGYASIDHTHIEYASISNVESMIDSVSNNSVKYSDLSNYQVKHTVATITLYKNKWSNNTQTVSINNATATNTVIVGYLMGDFFSLPFFLLVNKYKENYIKNEIYMKI